MSPLHALIDIVFPSRCASCGRPVSFAMKNICTECSSEITYIEQGCAVCSGIIHEGECLICSDRKFYPEKHVSLFEYSGPVKELFHSIKFNGNRRALNFIAGLASEWEGARNLICDIVTPVPMNSSKKWKRGYNQSEVIARALAGRYKTSFLELLYEKRSSGRQNELGFRDRFINVIGRYGVKNKEAFRGKSVLIVDDIFTTGATVNECARILLENGASRVFSLSVARTEIKKLEKF